MVSNNQAGFQAVSFENKCFEENRILHKNVKIVISPYFAKIVRILIPLDLKLLVSNNQAAVQTVSFENKCFEENRVLHKNVQIVISTYFAKILTKWLPGKYSK